MTLFRLSLPQFNLLITREISADTRYRGDESGGYMKLMDIIIAAFAEFLCLLSQSVLVILLLSSGGYLLDKHNELFWRNDEMLPIDDEHRFNKKAEAEKGE